MEYNMTTLDYVWVILGFSMFLYAIGAKFRLGSKLIGFETGETLPLWDRMIVGAVGIIPLSLEWYNAVSKFSTPGILPWASAAACWRSH